MDTNNNGKSSWLERLQRESWNLELLISGFSIFLLGQALEALPKVFRNLNLHMGSDELAFIAQIFILITILGAHVLFINLVFHVILRGLWIGTIGLNSIQPKTTFEGLGYSDFFNRKIKPQLISLEKLIVKIDDLASVVFAFSFLILFMLLSLVFFMTFLALIGLLIDAVLPNPQGTKIALVIAFVILLLSFTYLFDTLTLGLLKRSKWISQIYYPIYWLVNLLTLSFLYRSLYYNFIRRFSRKRLALVLVPYILIAALWPFNRISYYTFFPDNEPNNQMLKSYYEDLIPDDGFIDQISIPSRIINDSYLPVFVRYDPDDNEAILEQCDDYTPSKEGAFQSGIEIGLTNFTLSNPDVDEADPDSLMQCLVRLYQVRLNDSLYSNLNYQYYVHHQQKEKGLQTVIDINHLDRGKHVLSLDKFRIQDDSSYYRRVATIPFWLE